MGKFHSLDVGNTLAATDRKSAFLKIAEGQTLILRFFPPVNADGNIFTKNTNHFGLEEDDKAAAFGCLNEHGNGNCPLCKVAYYLIDSGNKSFVKVGKEIKASNNWYAQVLNGKRTDSTIEWSGPYLMRFSKTGADAITAIIRTQATMGEAFITDPEKGKPVLFTRTGSGFDTRYSATVAADPVNMDDAMPGWEDAAFDDIPGKLDIKVRTPEQMIAAAAAAHSLDWETILKEAGVS